MSRLGRDRLRKRETSFGVDRSQVACLFEAFDLVGEDAHDFLNHPTDDSVLCYLHALVFTRHEARILGNVRDQNDSVITALFTVTDVARGISRTLVTDPAGEYAPNLIPGTYSVRAQSAGFRTVERQSILLEVGAKVRVDLSLQPGAAPQTITVTAAPPLVDTTNATWGGTLSNQTIDDLPLNGRNYENLLQYRPGIVILPGGGMNS